MTRSGLELKVFDHISARVDKGQEEGVRLHVEVVIEQMGNEVLKVLCEFRPRLDLTTTGWEVGKALLA